MKKISILFLTLALAFGCESASKPGNDFAIGLISGMGGFDDNSFNSSCKKAIENFADKNNIESHFAEINSQEEALSACAQLVKSGCTLIFAPGMEAFDAVKSYAKINPNINFVLIDNDRPTHLYNVKNMTFHVDQAAFPLGFLSAWWAYKKDTANPRVGWIGGMNLPEIRIFTESFTAGINHFSEQYNIEILISQGYTNSFNDPDLGRSIANLMLNSGTEIIFPVAGKTGTGAYDVIAARDKWAIGVDIDMHESDLWYSKIFISSCIKNFNCAVSQIAYEALQNNFNNETYTGTLENKGVCMAPYHNFDRAIADSIEEEIIAIKEGIISGKINTGWN